MKKRTSSYLVIAGLAALLLVSGCHKKETPPPPPPPPPPAPTASLSANPDSVQSGQSTQLTWQTQNATDVSIDGLGAVDANGSKSVTPTTSTTYHLVAKGAGGTQEATARVTVAQPAPVEQPVSQSEEQMFMQNVQDVFFDYDSFAISPQAQQQLAQAAQFLQQHTGLRMTVEGHCDERGSTEYNLALGDSRANAVRDALLKGGVAGDRIKTISYGKEKPFCTQSNDQCWQQNRRGHFVLQK